MKQHLYVWWTLWAAFQVGIIEIYYLFHRPLENAPAPEHEPAIWLAALAPVLLATIVRWLVLPRIRNALIAFPWFIAGIAFSETTCFLGLFLFRAHQQPLFVLSALGIFQFIPFFARRYHLLPGAQDQKPNLPG